MVWHEVGLEAGEKNFQEKGNRRKRSFADEKYWSNFSSRDGDRVVSLQNGK